MRASSSYSSAPSNSSKGYIVFLSFRGGDTRCGFTGYLYNSLVQSGINTFIDDKLVRGDEISQELLRKIEDSRLSLIVFSENYASSKWCLDELVHILECKRSMHQKVIPIFYKVEPSDVRHQRGRYGEFLTQHERKSGVTDKVLRWREALTEAANLSGHTLLNGKYEYEFVNEIVGAILKLFPPEPTYMAMPEFKVGVDWQVENMLEILDVGGSDVRMVGIWGLGGIGKTTIAKAVYNAIARNFDCCCFLENVREATEQFGGLLQLQNKLLSSIEGEKLKANNDHEGITLLRESMTRKKIILVVDDVDSLDQLEKLVGTTECYGRGSRIIITARDEDPLIVHQVNPIYKVSELGTKDALELFNKNAKLEIERLDADEKLLNTEVANYAKGNPLALKVLGSSLCCKSSRFWRDILDSFRREPPKSIQNILLIGYGGLQETARNVFLDIACFFKGWKINDVIQILEGCEGERRNSEYSIEVLKQKALVTVGIQGTIEMHDLLEEIGKSIVRKESKEPGERSRLWDYKDVQEVLTKNTGTRKVEGIVVKITTRSEAIRLSPKCFKKMDNLKIFINVNGRFVGELKYYPTELRFLYWPKCLPEYLFSHFSDFDMKKLVLLRLPLSSHLTHLGGAFEGMSDQLKHLNLRECKFLIDTDSISASPFLQKGHSSVPQMLGFLDRVFSAQPSGLLKPSLEGNMRTIPRLNDPAKQECILKMLGGTEGIKSLSNYSACIKVLPVNYWVSDKR